MCRPNPSMHPGPFDNGPEVIPADVSILSFQEILAALQAIHGIVIAHPVALETPV